MADGKEAVATVVAPQSSFLAEFLPEQLQPFAGYIEGIAFALLIFIIGWIISKWVNKLVNGTLTKKMNVDVALGRFLGNIAQYAVLAMAIIAALGKVGVQTTSLVAIFASAGLAVGLALQGSLSNFASGVMILFFKPFDLEDVITAGGTTGAVKDIGIFATTFANPGNDKIIVPNSKVIGGTIINHTTKGTRRATIDAGVAYGSDLKEVMQVLEKAAKRSDLVLADPPPAVAFTEMAASSINFQVHVWTNAADYLGAIHNVRSAIYDDLNSAGIDIPFDQVVMHNA